MKIKKIAAVIAFAVSIHSVQAANSIRFHLFAHIPLRCGISNENNMNYGLLFKNSFSNRTQFNVFSVNSNGSSVSFFIDDAKVHGLTSRNGSSPVIFFEDDKGRKLMPGSPVTIQSNGTGKYNFRFKIRTNKNRNFYRVNRRGAVVAAAISFSCEA